MRFRLRIPIRLKFMFTLLVLVTAVVGFITFSTAKLFQEDKQTYIHGLTSMVALGTADEAYSMLAADRDRLRVYSRMVLESSVPDQDKPKLSESFFADFPDVLAIELLAEDREPLAVFDVAALEQSGLDQTDLRRFQEQNPLPLEEIRRGRSFVRNATISHELPMFTLAFATSVAGESQPVVVAAWIRSERLLRLASRLSAFDVCLSDSEGNVLAHTDRVPVLKRAPANVDRGLEALKHTAGVTLEYEVDGQRVIGGYANVDFADLVATAEIPRSAANLASRKLLSRMMLVAVVLVGLAVVLGFFWAHRIARPVENLALATRMIGKGQFDVHVAPETNDEIGSLAGSFNQMTAELQHRDQALHEAQAKLVQSEKMAAFGQLGAGIAHEVKNPLAGILASAQVSKMDVDPQTQVYKDLGLIEKETKRCKTIIDNLLKFARQEQAIKTTVRVNAVIEDAIAIVNHQLELNKVKLEMQLEPDLPPVHGNPNQLQQVFMNLMINAQQAMDGKSGSLTVSSRRAADNIEIVFADTGPGISEEARQKLFEPFFTTKSAGKGTGLGLSVSFGLIEDHGGEVTVESEVGQGATFIVSLPAFQKDPDPLSRSEPELVGSS